MRNQILMVTNIQWPLFFSSIFQYQSKKSAYFQKVTRVHNLVFHKFDFENNRKWLQGTDTLPQG